MKLSGYIGHDTGDSWLDGFTPLKLGTVEICALEVFLDMNVLDRMVSAMLRTNTASVS